MTVTGEEIACFAADEAKALRAEVAECTRCGEDGWCAPLGPKADGSFVTSRPCPNGCAGRIADAVRFETGKW
ncbi:hypothetical protein [Roseivivax sp. CAU 1761]